MSPENLVLFLLAASLVTLSPGPDILTVITRSVAQGTAAGLIATLGFATGLIFHTTVAATGLALLVQNSPVALRTVHYAGAAYLLYLALRTFLSKDNLVIDPATAPSRALRQIYGQSVLMNILNPKVTLFFIAFLPPFVERTSAVPVWMQMIIFGTLFAVSTVFWFGSCAITAGRLSGFVRRHKRAGLPLRIGTGLVFTGLAVSILLTGVIGSQPAAR
jgi:threonine/homoserine/homoserine lactone efflux protein